VLCGWVNDVFALPSAPPSSALPADPPIRWAFWPAPVHWPAMHRSHLPVRAGW